MYPGLSETDYEAVMIRHQELVARGLHEQFVGSVLPPSAISPVFMTMVRKQLGAILLWAGERLQGVPAATHQGLGSVATDERGAIAA